MAEISGQQGASLTNELAQYLQNADGEINSQDLAGIINEYLSGGDQLSNEGTSAASGIYKKFNEFDKVTGKVEVVTTGLWTGNTGSLGQFHSSSQAASSSGDYYYNVYQTASLGDQVVQFAVAYGHISGSGSVALSTDDDAKNPTKATYMQYRSYLLGQADSHFSFVTESGDDGHNTEDIFVINVARARYKEMMDPGNWSLSISGSHGIGTFIDDSGKKFSDTVGKSGRVFNVVSGSLNLGTSAEATVEQTYTSGSGTNFAKGQGYGLFYPDQGIIILNPGAIEAEVGVSIDSGSKKGYSTTGSNFTGVYDDMKAHTWLYNAIKGGGDFEARRTENVSTSHYFVRAQNRDFNFSNNPTFVSGSDNTFAVSSFKRDPRTYITTIGLYNNANEMLAVAKTSQPIAKSFDKEVLVKVKLDF
tara:strand:- start:3347 stop:4600 length:1254 start_codon:yes stop_codon:yes gene_type:complete